MSNTFWSNTRNTLQKKGFLLPQPVTQPEFEQRYEAGERDFRGCQLLEVKLSPFLPGIDLRHGDLRFVKDLPDVLAQAGSIALNLEGVNLQGANLSYIVLARTNLKSVQLSGANLQGASLQGVNLQNASLDFTNLNGAELSCARLQKANLQNAFLVGANLYQANLKGANLTHANLEDSNLSLANLNWANLSWANLPKSNLSKTWLRYTNLSYADLEASNLMQAKFWRINLEGVRSSDEFYLSDRTKYSLNGKFPFFDQFHHLVVQKNSRNYTDGLSEGS